MPALTDLNNGMMVVNDPAEKIVHLPEAASQTFVRGEPLKFASGAIEVAATAGNSIDTDSQICGIALADASGTTGALVPVQLFHDLLEWTLPMDGTANYDNVGISYTLQKTAAGLWVVTTTTTKGLARVIGIPLSYGGVTYAANVSGGPVTVVITQGAHRVA